MEDLTGRQFGPYRIVEPLGEGGMAAVYKAFQPGMDRYVALKVLPRQLADSPEFVGRFEQEAKILAKLQHPHILPVFDYGEAEGYTYIVMPFVKSGTLDAVLEGVPLSLSQINRIISQVGDALDYAHSQGLIHRDVKPSNILIDERGNCLLTDFGIAKLFEATVKFTGTGGIIGTPAYMSPEQAQGDAADHRSDIYSLGIVLYEVATGRVPFHAETPIAVIFKHIQDPLNPPRSVNPALPEAVEQVIFKALAKDPQDRYTTAGDMVRALQQAVAGKSPGKPQIGSPLLSTSPPTSPPAQRRKSSFPKWLLAVGAIGAVIVLLAVVGLLAMFNKVIKTDPVTSPTTASTVSVGPTEREPLATVHPSATPLPTVTATFMPTDTPTTVPTATLSPTTASPPTATAEPHLAANMIAYDVQAGTVGSILLIKADGSGRRFLPGAPSDHRIANFSPDGDTIAFRAQANGTWQIFAMRLDGSGLRQITGAPGNNYEANWSPDGQQIAFVSDRDGNREIYLMNADGSNQRRITDNPEWEDDPAWSPDGKWIVFESLRNGRIDVYKIQPDGSHLTQLTFARERNATPAWSPDGRWIAFDSKSSGQEHVWIMGSDGSDQRRLTAAGTVNQRPAWSPDSTQIAFTSDRSGATEIWIMNVDGSSSRQLTNEAGAYNAAWSRW